MTKQKATKTAGRYQSPIPVLMPDVNEFSKLFANRNQAALSFYFDRLHEYENFYSKLIDDYTAQAEKFFNLKIDEEETTAKQEQPDYEASLLEAQSDAAQIIEQAKAQAERIINGAYTRAEQSGTSSRQTATKTSRRKSA